MDPAESALMELFTASRPGSDTPPPAAAAARDEVEELLERVIQEELATLHEAFGRGAEFAVTRMESPRDRVLHRLECSTLEPSLDRRAQWSAQHRARLAANPRYRISVPTLVNRDAALALTEVRNCKVCWPNVHGDDPRPLRKLQARGLRAHHVDHVLATERGESLGTIVRMTTHSSAGLDGRKRETVEVVTSWHTLEYAPSEHVYIWDLPTDAEAIERKMKLFASLGSGISPAW